MGQRKVYEERRRYWSGQVSAWSRSGLSQRDYARREGVSVERLGYWKRRLLGRRSQASTIDGALVAVPHRVISAAYLGKSGIGVVVDGRYRVEVSPDFCPETFESVVRRLSNL